MRIMPLLLFFLLIPFSIALTPIEADTMEAQVTITNTVVIEPAGSRYRVDEASGTLTWFPRQNRLQEVISLETTPSARELDDRIIFNWNPPASANTLRVDSTIKTRNSIVPVRDQIPFPLQDIPADVAVYLEEGEIIDQNAEIQRLAQQLAAGKTDTYEVVFTLADWTTSNIKYSLATAGEPASQKSSEVLQSRAGKCDELTALFISMNRALGIPARFVAGYSYTTSEQFAQPWGGHGWAEVWLPGQGWVPFDVTYGEYGYLDAGHVVLKIAPDAKENSIDFSARGNDFNLVVEPLTITVTPTKMTERDNTDITITLRAPQRRVGFGSAVLVLAEVTNERDYYVSTRLDLAKTTNSEILSDTYRNILLRPYETKTVAFLARIDGDLASGYKYTFPFKVHSRIGPEASITIEAEENLPVYDESAYAQELERYTAPIETSTLAVTCQRGKVEYVDKSITHICTLSGADKARICEGRACFDATGSFTIETTDRKAGVFTRTYTANANGETVKFFVTSRTVMPTEVIVNFTAPAQVRPVDTFEVLAQISSTGTVPQNVEMILTAHHSTASQKLNDLSRPGAITFTLPGRSLRPGQNEIGLTVSYTDEVGASHHDQFWTKIELVDVTAVDRVMFWLEDAGAWVEELVT